MNNKLLSENNKIQNVGQYISQGAKIVFDDLLNYIGYFILYIVITLSLSMIPFLGSLANWAISLPLSLGFATYTYSKFEHSSTFNNFFDAFKKIGDLIIFMLLKLLLFIPAIIIFIIMAGTSAISAIAMYGNNISNNPQAIIAIILTMIPAILILLVLLSIISLFLKFGPYLVYFNNYNATDALKESFKIGKENFLQIFIFSILVLLVSFLGVLALGIGVIVSTPIIFVAEYLLFRHIAGNNKNSGDLLDEKIISE